MIKALSNAAVRLTTRSNHSGGRSLVILCLTLLQPGMLLAADKLLAFPGAEGFGRHSQGGRGGQVLFVTSLADYIPGEQDPIPGSLRLACLTKGPRTILFRTSGTIALKTTLTISEPFLTIAGQSAPGDGICLRDEGITITAHDVIVQYLRVRPGDLPGPAAKASGKTYAPDAISLGTPAHNVIIDHCSASWSIDECLSVSGAGITDVTVQWCLISEALDDSFHPKGPHGYGSLLRTNGNLSFHHNLYAHHRSRSPRPGTYGDGSILLDFRNNVVFNSTGYSAADPVRMNYVGNYIKRDRGGAFNVGGDTTNIYVDGNLLVDAAGQPKSGAEIVRHLTADHRAAKPYHAPPIFSTSAETAYKQVLISCGATLPKRDPVDQRVIQDVRDGTGNLINSQQQVGGWPALQTGGAIADRDHDGLPDDWEENHGLGPDSPANAQKVTADGYTHLEHWLHSLSRP